MSTAPAFSVPSPKTAHVKAPPAARDLTSVRAGGSIIAQCNASGILASFIDAEVDGRSRPLKKARLQLGARKCGVDAQHQASGARHDGRCHRRAGKMVHQHDRWRTKSMSTPDTGCCCRASRTQSTKSDCSDRLLERPTSRLPREYHARLRGPPSVSRFVAETATTLGIVFAAAGRRWVADEFPMPRQFPAAMTQSTCLMRRNPRSKPRACPGLRVSAHPFILGCAPTNVPEMLTTLIPG